MLALFDVLNEISSFTSDLRTLSKWVVANFPRLARLPRIPAIRIGRTGRRLSRASTLRGLAFFLWEKKWFFIAMGVGALMLSFDPPAGLTLNGYIVLSMSVMSVILFVTEPVPLPSVALMIIVGQVLLARH